MKKIFLDTNVWLRFLLQDTEQAEKCVELIKAIELGKLNPYISAIVLLEVNYIFTFTYKRPAKEASQILRKILKTRNLTVIDKTNTNKAMSIYTKYRIKFTDCLIASQLPSKTTLVSFDRDFIKIPGIDAQTPRQVLEKLEGV